ncbi:uncharacterized protein CEXT_53671 [Caerostris extrusa]|uniref:Tetratricopeptide repeat protein 29 n=1 Tax=Caerostris extrusa TaxID=172846 RepID=A0AAV4X9L0_CAEEX|nr:uncharacterized protein CEXT_53671 [Caerostris extrusa]
MHNGNRRRLHKALQVIEVSGKGGIEGGISKSGGSVGDNGFTLISGLVLNFKTYLSLSEECNDAYGICNAHFALSEIYKRLGDLEKSTDALTKCQKQAQENGFWFQKIFSSISYGQLETAKRNYLKAHEYFETSYRTMVISEKIIPNITDLHKLCRVMCGVGRAHRSFNVLISALQAPPEMKMSELLTWRNTGVLFLQKLQRNKTT